MQIHKRYKPRLKLHNGTPAEKAKIRADIADGVMKARLVRSGLWNPDAAMKSSLKVYRAGEQTTD